MSLQILLKRINLNATYNYSCTVITRNAVTAGGASIASLGKKKKLGKTGAIIEKKVIPVETDANKLVNFVCGSNILKEGGEDTAIKPDSEYPEWLWTLRTGRAKSLEEMDPGTKEFWIKVRKMERDRKNKLTKLRKY